jgi:hypothetical protein
MLMARYPKAGGALLTLAFAWACGGAGEGRVPSSGQELPGQMGAPTAPTATEGPTGGTASVPPEASGDLVRRLSRTELDNTLRDWLGDASNPASRLLAEDEFAPFDNGASLQRASAALVESLELLAADVAARVLGQAELRARVMVCEPTGLEDDVCFDRVVAELGRRAYRRNFSAAEVARYRPLLELVRGQGAAVGATFDTAVGLVLRSLLQDPEFLYRIEVGTPVGPLVHRLDGFEVATRLSYLLWGSTPDDALLSAAGQGELETSAGRQAQAERLFADGQARVQWNRYHAMWLGYRAMPHPAELAARFTSETEQLVERAVFGAAPYASLFQSSDTYLDEALATHYGLTAPVGGGWVTYPQESGRAGVLSHGSVLSGFSKFSDTSPTQRGIFVRSRLMCDPIAPPPPVVDVDQPPMSAESNCKEARYASHREIVSCRVCHEGLDLVGFGLEAFDIAGRFRSHDDGKPECAISGQGQLPALGAFNGPRELAEKLTAAGELEHCAVSHFLRYAEGRPQGAADEARLGELLQAFVQQGGAFKDLVRAYVAREEFGERREGVAP